MKEDGLIVYRRVPLKKLKCFWVASMFSGWWLTDPNCASPDTLSKRTPVMGHTPSVHISDSRWSGRLRCIPSPSCYFSFGCIRLAPSAITFCVMSGWLLFILSPRRRFWFLLFSLALSVTTASEWSGSLSCNYMTLLPADLEECLPQSGESGRRARRDS